MEAESRMCMCSHGGQAYCARCVSRSPSSGPPTNCLNYILFSDYLDALKKPNVVTISSPVERFTENAFVTADGKSHDVDVVVLATGYDVVRHLFSYCHIVSVLTLSPADCQHPRCYWPRRYAVQHSDFGR